MRLARPLILLTVAGVFAGVAGAPADGRADDMRRGDLTILDIDHGYGPLAEGGSSTPFSIRPPASATCPGDTFHDNWMLQTFVVPASVAMTTVKWGLNGPEGKNQYALYDDYTHPVVQVPLRQNTAPGQPGQIDAFRPMDFSVLKPGMLPAGTYRVGLACTHFRKLDSYWDTNIVITDDAHDKPAAFSWRLLDAPTSSSSSSGTSWPMSAVIVIAVALLTGVAVRVVLRRRNSVADGHNDLHTMKEQS